MFLPFCVDFIQRNKRRTLALTLSNRLSSIFLLDTSQICHISYFVIHLKVTKTCYHALFYGEYLHVNWGLKLWHRIAEKIMIAIFNRKMWDYSSLHINPLVLNFILWQYKHKMTSSTGFYGFGKQRACLSSITQRLVKLGTVLINVQTWVKAFFGTKNIKTKDLNRNVLQTLAVGSVHDIDKVRTKSEMMLQSFLI